MLTIAVGLAAIADVKRAFLNAQTEEKVHITMMAPGYEAKEKETGGRMVTKLNKGLHNIRQRPRNWQGIMGGYLYVLELGFTPLEPNSCFYICMTLIPNSYPYPPRRVRASTWMGDLGAYNAQKHVSGSFRYE